jgi:outer membrane protein assembly factor BamB
LWAFNPDTGKLRWFAQTGIRGNVSPSVVASDGVIFATGGFPQLGTVAVRGGGKGDVTRTHVLWSSELASYVPSPVVQDGHLYFVSDQGFATCLDAKTGNVLHRERLPGFTGGGGRGGKPLYASTLLAGRHLYAVSRRNGMFVLDATPQMTLITQNSFAGDDSDFNATPAISGNQLFLRSNRYLYCVTSGAGG